MHLRATLTLFFLTICLLNISAQDHLTCKSQKQCLHRHQNWAPLSQRASFVSISDSIDLLKHTIVLDLTDFTNFTTKASCTIEFAALTDGISTLPLQLKNQTVDSVLHNSGLLDFVYENELLQISLPQEITTGMSDAVTVYYRGGQVTDPSGFGGFYFNSSIAYNIGVAFSDWPASYGRAWFPCFDNFVEKSIFEYQVLTADGRSAFCNGYLQSIDSIGGDTVLTTWIMDHPLPSYLASVAVSDYQLVSWEFESVSGDTIPVYLVGNPGNISNMVSQFVNLEAVFHAFEDWFGEYRWPRIGFNFTPVGAMEHSTNISFPTGLIGAGDLSQSVMAHELAHEWFGNLVTCKTPADMWLNEGWAEFLSILVYEVLEGNESYADRIRGNHRQILQTAHYEDGGHHALNNLPPEATYGEHAYNKGAAMAHNLRKYIGDELFFPAMTAYLNQLEYGNASSEDLRDFLNNQPGINVSDFFNDWIFQPGWSQFSVDEIQTSFNGTEYNVSVLVKQRLRAAQNFYQNVPLTLSLMDQEWNASDFEVTISGEETWIDLTTSFMPVYGTLNRDEKLSYGVTSWEPGITQAGILNNSNTLVTLIINELTDNPKLRIEHNWAGPGGSVENDAYIVSPDRYWRIGGILNEGNDIDLRLEFDGRNSAQSFLDVELFALPGSSFDENNLALLYRSEPDQAWQPWPDLTIVTLGSATNGYARITAHNISTGEFAFGWPNPDVSIEQNKSDERIIVYPNPASTHFSIAGKEIPVDAQIILTDLTGKTILSREIRTSQNIIVLPDDISTGTYVLQITGQNGLIYEDKLLVK